MNYCKHEILFPGIGYCCGYDSNNRGKNWMHTPECCADDCPLMSTTHVFKTNKAVDAAAQYWVNWARRVNSGVSEAQLSMFKSELMKNLGKPISGDRNYRDGGAWGSNKDERSKIVKDALDVAGIPHFNPGVIVGVSIVPRHGDPRRLTVQAYYHGSGSTIIAEVVEEY